MKRPAQKPHSEELIIWLVFPVGENPTAHAIG